MNLDILIADPDRDFLSSFRKLLEISGNTVSTVFDGTQAIISINDKKFDMVILNKNIPRIEYSEIIKLLNDKHIPVIVTSDKKIKTDILMNDNLANSYLTFPFLPNELTGLIDDIYEKIISDEKIKYSDMEADISKFTLCGKVRITNEEIDILRKFILGKKIQGDNANISVYINALNNKFEKLGKNLKIRYMINQGYRLVTDNE